jgi:hypothetical protein
VTLVTESKSCNVCGHDNLEIVFENTALPLTGLYIAMHDKIEPPRFDQALLYCERCGHGQLRYLIDADTLYDDTYTHRTSGSAIATHGNDFFFDVLKKTTEGRHFNSLLEIGCNDLYLLKKMESLTTGILTGIDPIWRGKDHEVSKKIRVLGRFVEELSLGNDIEERPDLIVSAHTFEHVQNLYEQLALLVRLAAENCFFMIEVPSFETMVKTGRFDQVFHQHIQYTSLSSMRHLIDRLGCSYLGHTYNYSYWGGTFLFWFKKNADSQSSISSSGFNPQGLQYLRTNYAAYKDTLSKSRDQVVALGEKVYGFGAAQMLPILAYHMETDLGFMEAILDDNPDRANTRLPTVKPIIRPPQEGELNDAAVMITALDSARPIMQRLINLNPRRIHTPLFLV